jgi:hypothetical protein
MRICIIRSIAGKELFAPGKGASLNGGSSDEQQCGARAVGRNSRRTAICVPTWAARAACDGRGVRAIGARPGSRRLGRAPALTTHAHRRHPVGRQPRRRNRRLHRCRESIRLARARCDPRSRRDHHEPDPRRDVRARRSRATAARATARGGRLVLVRMAAQRLGQIACVQPRRSVYGHRGAAILLPAARPSWRPRSLENGAPLRCNHRTAAVRLLGVLLAD